MSPKPTTYQIVYIIMMIATHHIFKWLVFSVYNKWLKWYLVWNNMLQALNI